MTTFTSEDRIKAGAEIMSDKGYEESTHEKQREFAEKRNYTIPSNPDMIQVRNPDGEEVIRIAPDGRIYWKTREVTTDQEFRDAMMELAQRLAGRMNTIL